MFSQKLNGPIALVAAAIVVGGGAYGIVSATAGNGTGTVTTTSSSPSTSGQPFTGGGGSNARSGPAAGGFDRVVELSNGDYEVHNIGVNWPHHIFVTQNFKVVGAD
jgi:hypothetical protein